MIHGQPGAKSAESAVPQALPNDAWIRAEVAFAAIAWGGQSRAADVLQELSDTLQAIGDPSEFDGWPRRSDRAEDHSRFTILTDKTSPGERARLGLVERSIGETQSLRPKAGQH
jgi:hypothetical protein